MSDTPQLGIGHIEVVQSIQKVDNSVPFTANRRTAVRVFLEAESPTASTMAAGRTASRT